MVQEIDFPGKKALEQFLIVFSTLNAAGISQAATESGTFL